MPWVVPLESVIDFEHLTKSFIKANDAAMTVAAAKALPLLRDAQPQGDATYPTTRRSVKKREFGKLKAQTAIKYFKQKNKLRGAALKVIGDRHFVSVILENGTKDGRIPPRKIFESTAPEVEAAAGVAYHDTFFQVLESEVQRGH